MKAVIQCGGRPGWADTLGASAWPLLPAGNRPLLEYWLELCVGLGIRDVRLLLGDGAEFIEAYAGAGERWGLEISYGFLREGQSPAAFFRRSPEQWQDGLLFAGGALFPRRTRDRAEFPAPGTSPCAARDAAGEVVCLLSGPGPDLDAFCTAGRWPAGAGGNFTDFGLDIQAIDSVRAYYELNMDLVRGEITRYLAPGYHAADGAYVGYNVILPPGVQVQAPLMIGNDCRLAPLSAVGPDVVLGSRVVIDAGTVVTRSVVLAGTYVGSGLEIEGKIVSGRRMVDPESGAAVDIEDPWLLAPLGAAGRMGDGLRAVFGWILAGGLLLLQAVPFALLYPWARGAGGHFSRTTVRGLRGLDIGLPEWRPPPRKRRRSDLFVVLGLDLFPRLWLVLRGRLSLCGHPPLRMPDEQELVRELARSQPGAISAVDRPGAEFVPGFREIEARAYAHSRSWLGDAALIIGFFWRRLSGVFTDYAAVEPSPPKS